MSITVDILIQEISLHLSMHVRLFQNIENLHKQTNLDIKGPGKTLMVVLIIFQQSDR